MLRESARALFFIYLNVERGGVVLAVDYIAREGKLLSDVACYRSKFAANASRTSKRTLAALPPVYTGGRV